MEEKRHNSSESLTTILSSMRWDFCTQHSYNHYEEPKSATPSRIHQSLIWCRDHKLAISAKIVANLYRAAHHAHSGARTAQVALVASADLMRHSKAAQQGIAHTMPRLPFGMEFKEDGSSRELQFENAHG